ncbi:MAG: beta-L-arabinofuranosidase domain-containing protein [Terriglobales bacterium]
MFAPENAHGATDTGRSTAAPARYAFFRSLAPGDVWPEGWLQLYLQKQAQQLGSHLPEVSWPFTDAYWAGEEKPPEKLGWWPWEQRAYWTDGALRCALALQDEKLIQGALTAVEYTLSHSLPDGYLGPAFARDAKEQDPASNNFRWPHTVFFRALAAHGEATRDPRVAAAIRRHYLADKGRVDYGGPSRNVTNIEGMLWAYERTGDQQLLALAEKAWNDFLQSAPPGDRESGDLNPDRVFANTPIHAHGVTYIEKAKLPAILYMYTGNPDYLRFALAAQERIFSHHMLIDGIPSTTEMYHGTTPLDAHETCDISDHTWSWGYLLMATGDGIWADRIERACFNAGMGAIRKDWKAVQYFSCPNQVIATQDSSHVPYVEESKGWMAYRPNPGREVACCGGNVHRVFPNYVIRMWMADPKDGGLAAMLYGASTVRAEVGANRESVEIRQETNYPFGDEIQFTLSSAKSVTFPLSLRIPGWCKAPRLAFNGQPLELPPLQNGLARLVRRFHPGDRITLTLPMQTVLTYWPSDGVGVEHGPLVYALAVKEDWTPIVTPKWSTAQFPEWDARAANAWNYGIAVDETRLISQTQFERKPMTNDPWVEPPVTLTVPMRKIPGWELCANSKHPDRKETPPLPEIDEEFATVLSKIEIERVSLVPYGATQLRLAIFPET